MDASGVALEVCRRVGAAGQGYVYEYAKSQVEQMQRRGEFVTMRTVERLEMETKMLIAQMQQKQGVHHHQKKAQQQQQQERGRGEEDENVVDEEIEAEVFQRYSCGSLSGVEFYSVEAGERKRIEPSTHPGDIAESGLLASVPLPKLTYCTGALSGCCEKKVLSDLQLEGALHASQRFLAVRNGYRAGFFLGDGAGVGKGRQIAAIILDTAARGQGKHMWISIGSDLRVDAERDLKDVGCYLPVIDSCASLDATAKLALGSSTTSKRGVVFTTYSTLISATRGGGSDAAAKKRLDQLVDWCGGPLFDGCLVFDEAHKAKNFNVNKVEASTKMAAAAIEIQNRLPLARVVYASATGVSEISNMAYCERLGLWGVGTPFESFANFAATMEKRGVGALEMLALELKASGGYVSRGLSWAQCEFEQVVCALDADAMRIYDVAATWWRALKQAMHTANEMVKRGGSRSSASGSKRQLVWQRFWGAQLRFFKELQTALKVPFVVEQSKAALRDNKAVVIGLQSTGEAGLDAAMRDAGKRPGDSVPRLVSAAKVAARRFVLDFFPTVYDHDDHPSPNENNDPDTGLALNYDDEDIARAFSVENRPPIGPDKIAKHRAFLDETRRRLEARSSSFAKNDQPIDELVQLRDAFLDHLEAMDLPPSPLDALVDALGGTAVVAEMTGRSARLVRKHEHAPLRYETRAALNGSQSDSLNVKERQAFMDGKKTVAIISDAASTGVSLHAALGTKGSGRRRIHVTLELAWSADKSIQQLGRSHRANQQSAPSYKLVTTNLGGENRFAAAVARRLASLGALTKGDRRAASGQDLSDFDVDNKHGRRALSHVADACTNRFANVVALNLSVAAHPALAAAIRAARDRLKTEVGSGSDDVAVYDVADGFTVPDFRHYLDKSALVLRKRASLQEPLLNSSSALSPDDDVALPLLARRAYAAMDLDPKKHNDVRHFLNRLQALDVVAQNLLFEYFCACHKAVLTDAKANGTLDAGVADLRAASAKVTKRHLVNVDPVSGARTVLSEIVLDRGVDWDNVAAKHDAALEAEHEDNKPDLLASGLLLGDAASQDFDKGPGDTHAADATPSDAVGDDDVVFGGGAPSPVLDLTGDDDADQSRRGVASPSSRTGPRRASDAAPSSTPDVDEAPVSGTEWGRAQRLKKWGTGFYVSRRPLPTTRKHGLLLAVRKAGTTNFVITRPNTGPSPYDYTLENLREKYEPHPASRFGAASDRAALRDAWTEQFEAALDTNKAGRKLEIGLVSGAVLPFWRALEATAEANRMFMTKAEQALKVCRVGLDDGSRLVGIRFPMEVLPALRRNLEAEKRARVEAAKTLVAVQPPAPVDDKAFRVATAPPKTIDTFFKVAPKRPAPELGRPEGCAARHPPAPRAVAPVVAASAAKKAKTAPKSIDTFFKPPSADLPVAPAPKPAPVAFAECPCCGDYVETTKMNHHLDTVCLLANK